MKFETFFDQEIPTQEKTREASESHASHHSPDSGRVGESQGEKRNSGRKGIHIPVEKQIEGLRKAIANPKTPSQLKEGMRKRLKKLEGES